MYLYFYISNYHFFYFLFDIGFFVSPIFRRSVWIISRFLSRTTFPNTSRPSLGMSWHRSYPSSQQVWWHTWLIFYNKITTVIIRKHTLQFIWLIIVFFFFWNRYRLTKRAIFLFIFFSHEFVSDYIYIYIVIIVNS